MYLWCCMKECGLNVKESDIFYLNFDNFVCNVLDFIIKC